MGQSVIRSGCPSIGLDWWMGQSAGRWVSGCLGLSVSRSVGRSVCGYVSR